MFSQSYMLCVYIRYKAAFVEKASNFLVAEKSIFFIAINVKHQMYHFGSVWFNKILFKYVLNLFEQLVQVVTICAF